MELGSGTGAGAIVRDEPELFVAQQLAEQGAA